MGQLVEVDMLAPEMESLLLFDGSHAFGHRSFFKNSVGFPVTKHLIYNYSVDTGLVENVQHLLKLSLFLYKLGNTRSIISMIYTVQTYRRRLNDL